MSMILEAIFNATGTVAAGELEKRYPRAWSYTKLLPALILVGLLVLIGAFNGWS